MSDVVVRELVADDLDRVATIEATANPSPWSRSLFAGELALSSTSYWVVAVDPTNPGPPSSQSGGAVVGYGGVSFLADTAHVLNLAVDDEYRRRGIGRRICGALEAETALRGMVGLTLEVRTSNLAAAALYQSLGMMAAGVRPGYYPDGEDAMIYWKGDAS